MHDSFLLDEVRCGFMVPSAIKQAWAAELEVLKEIDRVCRKHNIQYFADWGTLLGTVRHGGFIPWDDDLDIVMKREDYTKFMTVARFDMDEGFDVQSFRNHDDCWLFMGKVVGRNGFCFEKEHLCRFHNFQYIASVDIFVLDYVYRDPEKEEKRRELCKYMLAVADSIVERGMTREDREYRFKLLEERCGYKLKRIDDPVEMRRYLYGEIEKIFAEVPKQDADKLTQIFPWGLKGDWFQFPKEYYEKAVYLPFEYTTMPVPQMYDKMLRQRYGDYVKLVKTAGAHDYPFFEGQKKNLQKALDFELPEFRFDKGKLFRGEEEDACKAMSYKVMARECVNELWRMKEELAHLLEQEVSTDVKDVDDSSDVEQVLDLLAESQQLAVDLGNMLEQFLGEGCSTIPLLEQYCEAVYKIYVKVSGEETGETVNANIATTEGIVAAFGGLGTILDAIKDDMNCNVFKRKTVLFLPVLAKDWDNMKGLWQQYANDATCDTFVVPLPYYYKDYDGSPRKVCYEAEAFPEDVQALDYNLLTPEFLEMLHPEMIVIQNPYDSWNPAISVPEAFYSVNLRKYTDELVYVPPFAVEEYTKANEREYANMRYYVTMPGVVYADRILMQSEDIRQVYIERLAEFAGEETREVWEKRVKVCADVVEKPAKDDLKCSAVCLGEKDTSISRKKKLLYVISDGAYMTDAEASQTKIERNMQLFEECKNQIDVTVVRFPDDGYAECHAKDYDAYYGDVTPLVMEFRDAGKPVMVQDYSC